MASRVTLEAPRRERDGLAALPSGTEIEYLSVVLGEVYVCQRMFRTLPRWEELGGMMVRITRVGRQSKTKALTWALNEDTAQNGTRRPRPHAPRFDPHSNPILYALLVQLNSVPQLPATATLCAQVHRSSGPIAARLARIPSRVADQIPCSVPAHGIEIGHRISPRQCTSCSSHEVMSASLASSDSTERHLTAHLDSLDCRQTGGLIEAQTASLRSSISGIGLPNHSHRLTVCVECDVCLEASQPRRKPLQSAQNQPRNH